MPSTPILLSTAGAEPLSVSEARDWLRIEESQDTGVAGLIMAARLWFEAATDRQWRLATYALKLPYFTWEIEIPLPPLVSVVSVQYLDMNNTTQTVASSKYNVVTSRVPAVISPVFGQVWPATYVHPEAVTITYTAGEFTELIKTGMKLLVAHWNENRGDGMNAGSKEDVPPAVKAIAWAIASYRP